jgi:cytoskeleton protein RodZ
MRLGEQLRQARERQGLTLSQVAIETRILQQSIIALEEGAYDLLPSDVVVKGFIRNYAHFLGLPVDEMIELYRRERGTSVPIQVVPATTLATSRSYVLPNFLGVFLVTIMLVGLTYVVLSAVGRIGNPQVANQPAPAAANQPATPTPLPEETTISLDAHSAIATDFRPLVATFAPTSPPANEQDIASAPTNLPTSTPDQAAGFVPNSTPPAQPTREAPIMVELSIEPGNADCWMRVQVDDTTVYERIMRAGERETFLAQRLVEIRAGNPTTVNVSVNGSTPEPLGKVSGQPINWSWPPM